MITKHQLFCMLTLFEIGSTTLFALGIKSKQDAWIVILLTSCVGLMLLGMYILLQHQHPGKGIGEIILDICGPFVGIPLVIIYAAYFTYISSINLRDFCTLVSITSLEYTPLQIIMVIIMLPVIYLLCSGVTALAKSSEILFPVVAISLGLIYLLALCSGIFHPEFLLPVLPNGVKSLITGDLIKIIQFPYGEMITFLTFWQLIDPPLQYTRPSVSAIIFTGIFETVTIIFIICTLGPDYASVSTLPLFKVIRLINIANIITNLNAIGIVLIFIGGFFKISIFYFAAVLTIQSIWKVNRLIPIAVIGIVICVNTLCIKGFIRHIWSANYVRTPYIHGIFQFAIPLALILASIAKAPMATKRKNNSTDTLT